MVDLTQAHKASIELLGTRHTALVEAVRNYVNGSVQPSIDELIAAIEDVTTDIDTKEKMLLGLASRQAAKPVPSLILDFKTRHYLQGTRRPEKGYGIHDLLTVGRATPKWVYNASGKLVEVPAHEPAYQHDPVTGEPQGILIEESRTNLLLWSEDLTNSPWFGYESSITDSGMQSVIVGKNWQRITSNSGGFGYFTHGVPVTVTGTVSTSMFFRKGAGQGTALLLISHAAVSLDLATGTAALVDGSVDSFFVEDHGSGYRLVVTKTYGTDEDIYFQIGIIGSIAGEYIDVNGAQLEQASTPSSYIPTEDAPVTRAADNVSRELGDEFNSREGVIFTELELTGALVGGPTPWCHRNNGNIRAVISLPDRRLVLDLRGADMGWNPLNLYGVIGTNKLAVSYQEGEIIAALNGEIHSLSVAGSFFADIGGLYLGRRSAGNFVNSSYGGFVYYPYAMTETELQELTS